jgi:hypothetical protein
VSLDTSSLDQMGPVLTVSTFTPINAEIKVENDRSSNVLPGAAEVSSTAAF